MNKTKVIPKSKNGRELKCGNIIEIYSDPLRELSLEGKAMLMSIASQDDFNNTETWNVQFYNCPEDPIVQRIIKIHNS